MKSGIVIIAILASIVAGAGGGYVATQFGAAKDKPAQTRTTEVASLDGDATTEGKDHSGELSAISGEIGSLRVQLQNAEKAREDDAAAHKKEIDALNKKLAEMSPVAAGTDAPDAGAAVDAPPQTEEFKAAVRAEYQAIKAEEEAARQAADEKRRKEMTENYNKGIVDRLTTELALTEVQKTNISTLLADRSTKFAELGKRAGEAREAGEEFDFRAEMKILNDATLTAVKTELSSSQASTLDTLLGENGTLDSLGGWGGGRGFGGGQGGGRRGRD